MSTEKKAVAVVQSKGSTAYSNSGSHSHSAHYYGGNSHSSYGSGWSKPQEVFEAHGIEFWGTSKSKLDDIYLDDEDLIINCTGTAFIPKPSKPFIKSFPSWLNFSDELTKAEKPKISQIVLDWPDMSPPPLAIEISFWEDIIRQARARGIKRIICCCMAGQGRTGTALAAFMLALGFVDEPADAIEYIRENYNSKAVETQGQMVYLYNLAYDIQALIKDLEQDDDLPPEPENF